MRIAIPIDEDQGMDSLVSSHMGHAKFFLIYDSETKKLSRVSIGADVSGKCIPVDVLENESVEYVFLFEAGERALMKIQRLGIKAVTAELKTMRDITENLDKLKPLEHGCGH